MVYKLTSFKNFLVVVNYLKRKSLFERDCKQSMLQSVVLRRFLIVVDLLVDGKLKRQNDEIKVLIFKVVAALLPGWTRVPFSIGSVSFF